ncbi:unnamed protein product [Clonostachys byssicola]|uniref:Uncharacterized protein n=1 Tax=Clonostachys byssicola TaxID=160290 RepID=A0A9N9Y0Z2_9HYPO|nr:unnamed protein product [Clonostachys byssicola]
MQASIKRVATIQSVTSRLRSASLTHGPSKPQHATSAAQLPRTKIGPASDHLLAELLSLYWEEVERDVALILRTLTGWQREDALPEEHDPLIYGYETFLDQVCQSRREDGWKDRSSYGDDYSGAFANRAYEVLANAESEQRRDAVRELVGYQDGKHLSGHTLRQRARLLLQSAQWLDFDKVVEHREPLHNGLRLAPAQIHLALDPQKTPPGLKAENVLCKKCSSAIRGSMFVGPGGSKDVICQNCYFTSDSYGRPDWHKRYKTCCLDGDITTGVSQGLCNCKTLTKVSDGKLKPLFPITSDKSSRNKHGPCALMAVDNTLAEAKFDSTRLKTDKSFSLSDYKGLMKKESDKSREKDNKLGKKQTPDLTYYMPEFGIDKFQKEGGGTPPYLRPAIPQEPFGHVHMALRFGTVLVENGVANTDGGVVITTRGPLRLAHSDETSDGDGSSLLISGSERTLYRQNRPRTPKRHKLMAKQIVGGAFCGFLDEDAEEHIIDILIDANSKTQSEKIPSDAIATIMLELKHYLIDHVELHLSTIASKLIDKKFELAWNFSSNTCKDFCDNLLNVGMYQSLFAPQMSQFNKSPSYLMSFVCRPGPLVADFPWSKYDVPQGLVEEYLLRIQHGRHEDSDFIDSLSEYWSDFGAFGQAPYKYQDLFPWDCSEAYRRNPAKCGSCNISKHVWAFPHDSWSAISMHMARESFLYPPSSSEKGDQGWFQNRMRVLLAQSALLSVAAAMAKSPEMQRGTRWLSSAAAGDKDRIKLGSIHRAQPYSHHYERGMGASYFVPDWAASSSRLEDYERKREQRMKLAEKGQSGWNSKTMRARTETKWFFRQPPTDPPGVPYWSSIPSNDLSTYVAIGLSLAHDGGGGDGGGGGDSGGYGGCDSGGGGGDSGGGDGGGGGCGGGCGGGGDGCG